MTETVVVAIIAGGLPLLGTIISNFFTHTKTIYRIDQLEKKVEKHNNLVERMYCCENSINLLDEKIKNNGEDIDELKRRVEVGKFSDGNIA